MRGDFGVVVAIVTWQGVLRLVLKFVNGRLQLWMERALPSENDRLHAFMQGFPYRFCMFMVDTLLSVKLPETARKAPANVIPLTKE